MHGDHSLIDRFSWLAEATALDFDDSKKCKRSVTLACPTFAQHHDICARVDATSRGEDNKAKATTTTATTMSFSSGRDTAKGWKHLVVTSNP